MYDYGARNYDPALGRWMNIDPLAELYDNSSTYTYILNNPLIYTDPDGMRIDFTNMLNQKDGLNVLCNLLLDLSEQTGLTLSVNFNSDGAFLDFEKDNNEPVISKDGEYGNNTGSETARKDLMGAINDKRTLKVSLSTLNRGSITSGLDINLDPIQIDMHINNVSENLNPKTLGYGITFLHELQHSDLRGNLKDTNQEFQTGPTVDRVNTIRQELDENDGGYSKPYGLRKYYMGNTISSSNHTNKNYLYIIAKIHFTVINKEGESKPGYTKTKSLRKKE